MTSPSEWDAAKFHPLTKEQAKTLHRSRDSEAYIDKFLKDGGVKKRNKFNRCWVIDADELRQIRCWVDWDNKICSISIAYIWGGKRPPSDEEAWQIARSILDLPLGEEHDVRAKTGKDNPWTRRFELVGKPQ